MSKETPKDQKKFDYYIIDGKVYDFTDWIPKHPGGGAFFYRSNGRDISSAVHAYHADPSRLQRIMEKYEKPDVKLQDAWDPGMNVPPFIIPEKFDARRDMITFDWTNPKSFLKRLKEKLGTNEMQQRIKNADFWFDVVGACIFLSHVAMWFGGIYYDILPAWAFVIFFSITRTSMASIGHYHCHRRKDGVANWGDSLFDMQYVGATVILYDGHVMLHHMYTNSPADVKRTVFTGTLDLPVLWRVPVYTIHRFGQFLTGMQIRYISIFFENAVKMRDRLMHLELVFVRALLLLEFYFAYRIDRLELFFA